jgi:hypothetical protein
VKATVTSVSSVRSVPLAVPLLWSAAMLIVPPAAESALMRKVWPPALP